MRIVYLHQYFVTPDQSGGTRSFEFAKRLACAGHDVQMVTSDRGTTAHGGWQTEEIAGFTVHRLPVAYDNKMSFARRLLAFAKFALFSIGKTTALAKNADVVFATSTPLSIALPAVIASRLHDVPMIFEVRDVWPEMPIAVGVLKNPLLIAMARWLERTAYRSADKIIALSPDMKRSIVGSGVEESKVSVIPNGSDLELFDPTRHDFPPLSLPVDALACGRRVALYAGTLGLINGVSWLCDLAAHSARLGDDIAYFIVGDGMERAKVEGRARSLGVLNKNLFLLDPISKSEMPSLLARADLAFSCFLDIPEMWSNSANKFFDALASGTPVAINYEGWQKQVVEEARCGLVLPYDDSAAAAKMVATLLSDKKKLNAASLNARLLAEKHYSRDLLASRFISEIEEHRSISGLSMR